VSGIETKCTHWKTINGRRNYDKFETAEKALAEWFDDVQAVADAAMIAAGFHKHNGQWRRKRR
jgi:hypothetical protein